MRLFVDVEGPRNLRAVTGLTRLVLNDMTESLVRVRMRGLSMGTLIVRLNRVGVGVGPTLAGVPSEPFAHRYGADSVRWAMVCVGALNLPQVWLLARAATRIRADLRRARVA